MFQSTNISITLSTWASKKTSMDLLLRYLSGRVFVLDLIPGSQADVDKFICAGDILDEINGTSLRNSKSGHVRNTVPYCIRAVVILHFHDTIIQQNEFMLNISCNIRGCFVFVDHLYFDK